MALYLFLLLESDGAPEQCHCLLLARTGLRLRFLVPPGTIAYQYPNRQWRCEDHSN